MVANFAKSIKIYNWIWIWNQCKLENANAAHFHCNLEYWKLYVNLNMIRTLYFMQIEQTQKKTEQIRAKAKKTVT